MILPASAAIRSSEGAPRYGELISSSSLYVLCMQYMLCWIQMFPFNICNICTMSISHFYLNNTVYYYYTFKFTIHPNIVEHKTIYCLKICMHILTHHSPFVTFSISCIYFYSHMVCLQYYAHHYTTKTHYTQYIF